jgi:hypothetical protein
MISKDVFMDIIAMRPNGYMYRVFAKLPGSPGFTGRQLKDNWKAIHFLPTKKISILEP